MENTINVTLGPEVIARYPDLVVVFIVVHSRPYTSESERCSTENMVLERVQQHFQSGEAIQNHHFAAQYDSFYRDMGLKPKGISNPLKQASRVLERNLYRSILPIVDFAMAIEYCSLLSFQVFDALTISKSLTYRFSEGSESITTFHGENKVCKAGELILCDETGVVNSSYYGNNQANLLRPSSEIGLIRILKVPGIPHEALSMAVDGYNAFVPSLDRKMLSALMPISSVLW